MLSIVDKNGKNLLYVSEDSNLEEYMERNIHKNLRNESYITNGDVK